MRAVLAALIYCAALSATRAEVASYYGAESGPRTASGERFDPRAMTAASRTLPFGTLVRVTYRGRSVVVRINDRGPAKWTHRDIDLAEAPARRIGLISAGIGVVQIEILGKKDLYRPQAGDREAF